MSIEPLESRSVRRVAEEYRRRGYDVEIRPRANSPAFLAGFEPDLIACRSDDRVVVEVKVGTRTSVAERLRDIVQRVNQQPGWRFSLVYVNPDRSDELTEAQPEATSVLHARVQSGEELLQQGQREAAFLLLWSALEGILRALGESTQLPVSSLPPATLLRELYSAGELSRGQFEELMRLLPVRNHLVHGVASGQDLEAERLADIAKALLAEARNGSENA